MIRREIEPGIYFEHCEPVSEEELQSIFPKSLAIIEEAVVELKGALCGSG